MTRLRYVHLDVFADGPVGGHPLIVCLDRCPWPLMAALSEEFGLVVAFASRLDVYVVPGAMALAGAVRLFAEGTCAAG